MKPVIPRSTHRPGRVRRILPAIALLVAALTAGPGAAQYIYMDADGDGVRTEADSLRLSDTTWVDVWIDTAQNRDGTAVSCGTAAEPVTLFSYEFILRATGGTVEWGPYVNRLPSATFPFGEGRAGSDYHNGFGGVERVPPGLHRLATIGIVVATGTPILGFAAVSPGNATWITAFGSDCPGMDLDNTLKLGFDWFDWDGLGPGSTNPPPNHPPVLAPITGMSARAGESATQQITATDPDGDPLQFSKGSGPAYVTIETLEPGSGTATGRVVVAPIEGDAAGYVVALASDGEFSAGRMFPVSVLENVVPILYPIDDVLMVSGEARAVELVAWDPDDTHLTYSLLSGPEFVRVEEGAADDRRGWAHLEPGPADLGRFPVVVSVTDGRASNRGGFEVHVVSPTNQPPVIDAIPDVAMAEGADTTIFVHAYDPDLEPLRFESVSQPPGVFISTLSSDSLGAVGAARIVTGFDDAGLYEPEVSVTNGWQQTSTSFRLDVRDVFTGETSLRLEGGSDDPPCVAGRHRYTSQDGRYSVVPMLNMVAFGFYMPCTLTVESSPEEMAACNQGAYAVWTIQFEAADGAPLVEGVYENAVYPSSPGRPRLSMCGSDPFAGPGPVFPDGDGRFEIRRIRTDPGGGITSFWATFEFRVSGATSPLRGEARYHAMVPDYFLDAPTRRFAAETRPFYVRLAAKERNGAGSTLRASDLPLHSTFTAYGDSAAGFSWIPAFGQRGDHVVTFTAESGTGLCDTVRLAIHVGHIDRLPVAEANGPYQGSAGFPVHFTSFGSGDVDGDPVTCYWTFGDGEGAGGPSPEHVYARAGNYGVVLTVSDGKSFVSDATLALVSDANDVRTFVTGATGPVRLAGGAGPLCAAIEVGGVPGKPDDVLPGGLWMISSAGGARDSIAADPATVNVGDIDGNSSMEARACFAKEDLRRLLGSISGRTTTEVRLRASLRSGRTVVGRLPLDVIAPEGALPVVVAPNPMNPGGVLTLVTSQPGPVRVRLYDTAGRLVRTLLDAASLPAGYHDVPVDGRSDRGTPLSSGAYFYRVEAAEGARTGRIAIVR